MSYHTNEENGNGEEHEVPSLLQTRVIIRLAADNLPRQGIRQTLPDTFAVVRTRMSSQGSDSDIAVNQVLQRYEEQKTEVVHQSCRPQWTTSFPVQYEFGTTRRIFVRVIRIAKRSSVEEREVVLGDAIFEIGDILGSLNHTKIKRFPKGGVIFCRLEPTVGDSNSRICRFQFAARELIMRRGLLSFLSPFASAPDTIFQISKQHMANGQLSWIVVYRSQPVPNSLSPSWDTGQLDLDSLCNGELDRPIRVSVWTSRASVVDARIGEFETSLRAILNTQRDTHSTAAEAEISRHGFPIQRDIEERNLVGRLVVKVAQVIGPHSSDGGGDESESTNLWSDSGDGNVAVSTMNSPAVYQSLLMDVAALPPPLAAPATFLDYMKSWKLDLLVAIDFTSSNGDPRIPGSLHYQNSIALNDYEESMVAIGNAVAPCTADSLLETTVWGFGCKFQGDLRHIFQCGDEPRVFGVDGILQAYKSMFQSDLIMSGPTCFDQVLQGAAVQARRNQLGGVPRYTVLLVITDGICQNIQETERLLHVYSKVPLSVIFVGVGREDFGAMEDLVRDTRDRRPNASFVEFRRHQHDPTSLGRSALQCIPSQMVAFMQENSIEP